MNDPIRYMLTGAAIAILSGTVGLGIGVWAVRSVRTTEPTVTKSILPATFPPSQTVTTSRVLPTEMDPKFRTSG
jgi:hypothetical protein